MVKKGINPFLLFLVTSILEVLVTVIKEEKNTDWKGK